MRNFTAILMALCICFFSCTSGEQSSNTATTHSNNAQTQATTGGQASNTAYQRFLNPNKIGYEVYAALKDNDLNRFKQLFVNAGHYSEFDKMVRSVNLTQEQLDNSLGYVNKTLNFWTNNNAAQVERLFNKVRTAGENKGVNWQSTELTNFEVNIVPVNDFALEMTVYQILINFMNNGVAHQIKVPTAYYLENGILIADAVLNF